MTKGKLFNEKKIQFSIPRSNSKQTMKLPTKILLCFLVLLLHGTAFAQFKTDLRKANKEYELHAYNLAIKSYREALDRRPDDTEALSKIADSYRHLNQLEEAARYYESAIKKKDVEPLRKREYGHVLKSLGKYDEARAVYQDYAKTDVVAGNHYAESCNFAKNQQNAPAVYTSVNEFVNSSASDFAPAFYGTNQLIFSSARTDIQRGSTDWTGDARNQLFVANIGRNGYLEAPYFLKDDNRNAFNVGPVSYSNDGRWVAFTRNNFVDGTRPLATSGMNLKLYVAEVTSSGDWINEKEFPHNDRNNVFSVGFPCFSPDGNALYFSSDRPDGFGEFDIYVAYRTGGNNWGTAENLGPVINSPGSEIAPYFDGTNLFFSSDWHDGLGGYDVFRAESTNSRWVRIFHLGNGINSNRDDYGFIYNGIKNLGYLVSNRPGGRGNEDLYRVNKAADNIVIRVKNASDGSPISNAIVDFAACGEGAYQTNEKGEYTFQAIQGLDCNLLVRKDGYQNKGIQVTTTAARQNREFVITLNRVGEEYLGRIVNYTTRLPLEGVTITAVNQATGALTETLSDANGDYLLALSQNVVYVVRYSRPGFRDLNRTLRADGGASRDVLGVVNLIDANAANVPIDDLAPKGNDGNNNAGQTGTIGQGFAVQVASVNQPNMSQYPDLNNFGQLYSKKEGKVYKIRVGVFSTRQEATQVLNLVKNQGYKTAFIVAEAGGSSTNAGNLIPKGDNNTNNPTTSPTNGQYKIQLAAYKDLKNFDAAKVQNLGNIEERKRGALTVKYLGGYTSIEEARQALREVKAAGFKDAYVVENVNGELKKVQ